MLRRRSRHASLPELHPHQFRHTLPTSGSPKAGERLTDLMRLAG